MPVSEMLARVGSMEILEWIVELRTRAKEESDALKKLNDGQPEVLGG